MPFAILDFAKSLSGGFRRSLRDAARTRTRSKRTPAGKQATRTASRREGFTLRYPLKAFQDRFGIVKR